tara:strand:- start:2439 stop:2864 length:426 start_codon:yes stop_codon:yes gene_type:complete
MPFTKTEELGKLRELKRLTQGIKEDTELRNSIIKNLFNSRKNSGLTVETIAKYAGVTRKTIYQIMKREKEELAQIQAWQSWRKQYLNDDPNLRRIRKRQELMRKLHESDPNYPNWEATIKRKWKKIIESTELEWSDEQEDE